MTSAPVSVELSVHARVAVLAAAFLGLVFDGFELGLMPVASRSVTISLLGNYYTESLNGIWFARFTAALMLGAAIGGSLLGNLGDRVGRSRALGASLLIYALFAGLGAFVTAPSQMLVLRFVVGLGLGGIWPNGVALVAECWPNASRAKVSGVLGAGINFGIFGLALSQRIDWLTITPETWRRIFMFAIAPAILGAIVVSALPESPKWLAARDATNMPAPTLQSLFRRPLLPLTAAGIVLASVPLIGAWAGSKWMIPWADTVGGRAEPNYKAWTQGCWALGATIGSFLGAPTAAWLGRRRSYFLISLGSAVLTWSVFRCTAPLEPRFLPMVFAQGLVATLFFGWLPLYLPELFPVEVRASGAGVSMNAGRLLTAGGVLAAGSLFLAFGSDYATIGSACALIYALGMLIVFWIPETSDKNI
jgi:MFS transporter, SHS family, sialic acid transporter